MTPPDNEIPFEIMAQTAQKLIQKRRRDDFHNDEEMAAEAGVQIKVVKRVLTESKSQELYSDLTGKDWERLIAAAQILPEDWIAMARRDYPAEIQASGLGKYMFSSGEPPSAKMDHKITVLLTCTNSFYLQASTRYISAHGTTTDAGENTGDHVEGCTAGDCISTP